ncbi:MAG: hypothetical protein EA419_05675 [Wenzhouxiangella sp.]|nr:MAG: hypothetical protein EA419_05675 [Wenzhouxiangella sp.]
MEAFGHWNRLSIVPLIERMTETLTPPRAPSRQRKRQARSAYGERWGGEQAARLEGVVAAVDE